MDRKSIIGWVLIILLTLGYFWYSSPSEQQIAEQRQKDSIENLTKQKAEQQKVIAEQTKKAQAAKAAQAALADTTAAFHKALAGQAQEITLQNDKLMLTLNSKGATVEKAVIKGYENLEGKNDITLFDKNTQHLNFTLLAKEMNISTDELYFIPSDVTKNSVTFTAEAGPGKNIVIKYALSKDYMLSCSVQANGMEGMFAPSMNTMDIDWTEKCRQQEKGFTFENRYSTLTYHFTEGDTDYLNETSDKENEPVEDPIDWVAFKNQFFSAVMISKDGYAANAQMTSLPQKKGSGFLKFYEAKMKTAFDPTGKKASEFEFYFVPNDFRLLQDVEEESTFGKDLQLERLVYLGWPLFRIINRWFTLYVFDWLRELAIPMGIILILITLLLKVLTFPMVKKSYMSSAKMRVLRPIIEERTKDLNGPEDAMKKQQMTMQIQSEYGVNMLSGCLPMLIQMPIWIAMFNFVPNAIQLRRQSFLWIDDLSTYDPIISWNQNIWLIGDHLSLTCILFCGANLLYSWFTMQQQKDQMMGQQAEQMKMMRWMMLLMPLMFFFMFNDYSSGLNFYYFVSLLFSAIIMWALRKTTNDEKLLAILEKRREENKKNPKKLSGLALRLQKMQEEQERLKKEREEQHKRLFGK